MQSSTTLTSKGQLVIPKAVRDRLHLKPGSTMAVSVDGSRIVLETGAVKGKRLADWLPQLQVRKKISAKDLLAPVDDYRE